MSVPPLRLDTNFDSYISGEVIIHPSAVLAPGVILQAAPNSKIIIGPGVCIGMGSILQVSEDTLEIEAGANLGAGFLMVGKGKIGANACIGSASTVLNCSVQPGQVVPPGSLLGDVGRCVSSEDEDAIAVIEEPQSIIDSTFDSEEQEDVWGTDEPAHNGVQERKFEFTNTSYFKKSTEFKSSNPPLPNGVVSQETAQETVEPPIATSIEHSEEPSIKSPNNFGAHIYGQGNIQRLLVTLFPHRQSLNKSNSDDQSE
jgi:carbon dioxide concentrating mechanism protein CcmN